MRVLMVLAQLNIRKVVVTRLDSIGYGLLAAWIYYYYPAVWEKIRCYAFGIGIALLVFVVSYRAPVSGFYRQVLYYSFYPIAASLMLPLASAVRAGSGIVARSIIHISRISYSMYLIIDMALFIGRGNTRAVLATEGRGRYSQIYPVLGNRGDSFYCIIL
jgi:peptidoglycan/LPS O-acetylase OafA/YrhL